jgi:GcrA cell cycle regulator
MSANCATWTSERVELLKRYLHAGLSCGQAAREIRSHPQCRHREDEPPGSIAAQGCDWQTTRAKACRKACASKDCKALAPKASALNTTAHHAVAAFPRPKSRAEAIPIYDGRGCTLLELSQMRCRWPISSPGVKDFCFCGNEPVKGLPYCLGHARIAYQSVGRVGRQRSSAGA